MSSSPRRQARRFLLALLAPALCVPVPSCDRSSLEEGPKLQTKPDPGPDPGPDPLECQPMSASALRGKVFINEVMVLNTSTLEEAGAFPPWIEIHNATDEAINLGGMGLSDDIASPEKWLFPCNTLSVLQPRGFLIVFANGDTADPDDLHASFTLAVAPINLIINKGSNLFFFSDTSALTADRSVGRFPDGSSTVAALGPPTPGAANAAAPLLPAEGSFVRGDANDDGKLNVLDMLHVLAVLFGSEPLPGCQDRLDSDDTGVVDLTDSSYIGAFLFRRGPPFPTPFPDPGIDPTPDEIPCPGDSD